MTLRDLLALLFREIDCDHMQPWHFVEQAPITERDKGPHGPTGYGQIGLQILLPENEPRRIIPRRKKHDPIWAWPYEMKEAGYDLDGWAGEEDFPVRLMMYSSEAEASIQAGITFAQQIRDGKCGDGVVPAYFGREEFASPKEVAHDIHIYLCGFNGGRRVGQQRAMEHFSKAMSKELSPL